jgi:hypothetical protein
LRFKKRVQLHDIKIHPQIANLSELGAAEREGVPGAPNSRALPPATAASSEPNAGSAEACPPMLSRLDHSEAPTFVLERKYMWMAYY